MWLGLTVVALCLLLLDDSDLSQITCCSRLYKGHVGSQAHSVDVGPGSAVVQSVEDDGELLVEADAVLGSHDRPVQGRDVRIAADKLQSRLASHWK